MKMSRFEKLFVNNPLHALRQRRSARLLLSLGGDVAGGHALEVGCGRGVGVKYILNLFGASSVDALEVDPDQLRLARRRLLPRYEGKVILYEASATDIPSPDSRYDAVFEFNVLHHIHDNRRAIREIARVLKPGGRFFFQELLSPFTRGFFMRLFVHHPHEGQFTWDELRSRLNDAGLAVTETSFVVRPSRVIGVARKPS